MKCPNCRDKELEAVNVEGYPVQLDYCSACNGLWLDKGELSSMLDVPVKNLRVPGGASFTWKRCPHCNKSMLSFYYPGTFVKVDMCRKCLGLWLDKCEFEEIDTVRRFAKESGLMKNASAPPGFPEKEERGYKGKTGVKALLREFIDVNISALKPWTSVY